MNTEHLNEVANITVFGVDLAVIGVVALMTIMSTTGLTLNLGDFKTAIKSPKSIYFGFFSQLILLPFVAFMLVFIFEPAPYVSVGLIVLSCCPGGATSNFFTLIAKGNVAVSVCLTVISGLVTVFSIPLIVNYALSVFIETDESISLPVLESMVRIFVLVVLPVIIGMGLRHKYPNFSQRIEPIATKASFILVLLLMVIILEKVWGVIPALLIEAGYITLALNVIMMVIAFFGGRALSLDEKNLRCITIEIGVQNYLLSVVIALSMLKQPLFAIVPLLYLFIMYITVFSFIAYVRRFRGDHL